jgi:SAM-dependent methyltransferase
MALETARLNQAALEMLELEAADRLLEIGFGPGKAISLAAARLSRGFIAGVDVSEDMVRMVRRKCEDLVRRGLVDVRVADSASLPYLDACFDKVLCVHTIYFWKDPLQNLRETCRVLKPGGKLALGFRAKSDAGSGQDFPESVYTFYSIDEVATLLEVAGFEKITVDSPPGAPADILLAAAYRADSHLSTNTLDERF